jgi:hypothetical protein
VSPLLAAGLVPVAAVTLLVVLTPVLDRVRRRALRRMVKDAAAVLDAQGVDYWCDFGTLLGMHREGDLILGDKDADLCALETEKPKLLALGGALAERGLSVREMSRRRGLLRICDDRTPFHVDVYLYARDGQTLRSLLAPGREDVPERLVSPRAPVPFLGTTLLAPVEAPALLRHRYGPRYMLPRRNDKGASRPFNRWRSLGEDLEHACIGVWGLMLLLAPTRGRRAGR